MTPNKDQIGLFGKIKWLLFLRVVVLTFFLGAAALLHLAKGGDPRLFRYLQVPLISAYAVSIASALLFRWIKNPVVFAHAQIDFDV